MHALTWLMIPFAALCWRLGGGAFTTLTGVVLGTDEARGFRAWAAVPFAILAYLPPCVLPDAWPAAAPLCIYIGVLIGGWGPFQGMGLPAVGAPEDSWLRWLPERLGLKVGTLAHDYFGMTESGLLCMAPLAILVVAFGANHFLAFSLIAGAGLLFAPAYLLARAGFPTVPRFVQGQAWGEIFVGAVVGAALLGVLKCLHG